MNKIDKCVILKINEYNKINKQEYNFYCNKIIVVVRGLLYFKLFK